MSDLALMAATEWAKANPPHSTEPFEFGNKVALAYLACRNTEYHAGDSKAVIASLTALSIPTEVLQALVLLASHFPSRTAAASCQTNSAGTES